MHLNLNAINHLNFPAALPQTVLQIEQKFDAPKLDDIQAAVCQAMPESGILTQIAPNDSVAVGVGSRGIANLSVVVKQVIQILYAHGATPFIIPAMGSHGGATEDGQREVLAQFGITADQVGAEVRTTMAAVQIGQVPDGPPLFQDAHAHAADHTFLINRIKPHTSFRAALESGLAKMTTIGLGKQKGAAAMHSLGVSAFEKFLAPAARIYEANTNLRGGIGLLENAHDQTAAIIGLTVAQIGAAEEVALQNRAKSLMASLPFPEIDVLCVREIGKNISGTGMDPNIIGRRMVPKEPETMGGPSIGTIAVLDLTEKTQGNANGMGLANITTFRVAEKVNWQKTYTNTITAGIIGMYKASLPLTLPNDKQALQVALLGCGNLSEAARLVFIRNTLTLDRLWVSPSLRSAIEGQARLSIIDERPLAFTDDGTMMSPWQMA